MRPTCVPKCYVSGAFGHFLGALITLRPLAFLPHPLDRVAVALQIRGHVDDREEGNHDCRDAGRPQARLRVMVILQWTGTAGLGGPPAAPVGHNLPRPLEARLL